MAPPSISRTTFYAVQPRHSYGGVFMQAEVKGKRAEERKYMKVGVDLSSLDVRLPAHSGVTDNVSGRGARVLTSKPWKRNDRLDLRSMGGSFRSRARVVYCVPTESGLYAIGLQLHACSGDWISPA